MGNVLLSLSQLNDRRIYSGYGGGGLYFPMDIERGIFSLDPLGATKLSKKP